MKRQTSQQRNNLPPRINTPNNPDFIQDYFSGGHHPSPFSPTKTVDNNMFNMYFPNNQMMHPNNGPMYNTTVEGIENYELGDGNMNKNKHMVRGVSTPTTPIHPMNEMNQFNIAVPFRNGYEMYGDPQQQMLSPHPYIRSNGPFMNGGHHGNEDVMVGMNHVMKEQNNNLLSPVVMENTGGAQNNKKANLYKTELCRSFEETGTCRYGSKCQFAHSESELRHVDRHPKYKTEMCKTFWEQGTCPYGKRCCFIHTLREDAPGRTPTTPSTPSSKNAEKKMFPDSNGAINLNKKKEGTNEVTNNLSEGETIAVNSEESENTGNNRSRSGSDSVTATSITEEVISTTGESYEKSNEVATKSTENKEKAKADDKKEEKVKSESNSKIDKKEQEKSTKSNESSSAMPIKANKNNSKGLASSFEPMAKTPTTNQTFNYSTSFGGSMSMLNNNYVPRRKMSSPPQRQNQRSNQNNYNGILGMNSMSYQVNSSLEPELSYNSGDKIGINGLSTSYPANDFLDDKTILKLQNLHLQTTPSHAPVNAQRATQNNQGLMSPLSSSFNQNSIFMKQPLNVNTAQNSSNLFLKQAAATASPFTPGTPSSFLSPKQTHMGLPGIPLIDDETNSLKGSGSGSGKGSDFGDDVKSNATEEAATTSVGNNNLFVKQAINTSKPGTPLSFLKISQKPSTPKNQAFLPSTPQSISSNFLNNGNASPLPSSRLGTSLPSTPIHPNNSFNPSAIEDIFNGNNNTIINDFSRSTSSGINVAASPFTPSNDLSQYMLQMASARENTGLQSLENIKSPSQLFYRPASNSISAINTTSSIKSNGGFGSMTIGGINMVKNRSESFDYGMLSPNGMNSFLSAGNPVSSPVAGYNNSIASSFNSSFLANKMRSESVDFGQINHLNNSNKENNMVGSMPTLSLLQSINEGIPDSPFSNHGSIHGSPLPSTTTTLNDMNGMENFMNGGRRKSFQDSSLMMPNRLPTVPEGRHPNIVEEEEEHFFNNNNLTDEGILKFSKEHFGLDDAHSKSLLGGQSSGAMDIKGSILGGGIFSPMSPTANSSNFF